MYNIRLQYLHMNIERLYIDYSIPYRTDGHKHTRPGWVNIACPFCTGNPGFHLGYSTYENYYVCWRCGGHGIRKTISTVLKIPYSQVNAVIMRYDGIPVEKHKKPIGTKPFAFPTGLLDTLLVPHRKYLEKRKFDPDFLQSIWDIKATGVVSKLDKLDFKWRIVAPILWDGQVVSFVSRSISENTEYRYLVCPEEREILNIKKTLYGRQDTWNSFGVGVEGITDVWRLGDKAVGLYGIKYTPHQIRLIAKQFQRFPVLFDDDPQAVLQADKLVAELKFRGVQSWRVPITNDPASLAQDDADALIRELQTYKLK